MGESAGVTATDRIPPRPGFLEPVEPSVLRAGPPHQIGVDAFQDRIQLGRFYRTELYPILKRINTYLMRWARSKYRRLHGFKKARAWWDAVCRRYPRGFAHWQWTQELMPT